jgi:hypothetical protein
MALDVFPVLPATARDYRPLADDERRKCSINGHGPHTKTALKGRLLARTPAACRKIYPAPFQDLFFTAGGYGNGVNFGVTEKWWSILFCNKNVGLLGWMLA